MVSWEQMPSSKNRSYSLSEQNNLHQVIILKGNTLNPSFLCGAFLCKVKASSTEIIGFFTLILLQEEFSPLLHYCRHDIRYDVRDPYLFIITIMDSLGIYLSSLFNQLFHLVSYPTLMKTCISIPLQPLSSCSY
jgi:hypothetical protein